MVENPMWIPESALPLGKCPVFHFSVAAARHGVAAETLSGGVVPHLLLAALETGRWFYYLSKPIAHLLLGLQPQWEIRTGRTTTPEQSP